MAGKPGREVIRQMQRGFWTGVVHGGLLGAAFLLLASLLLPVGAPLVVPGAVPGESPSGSGNGDIAMPAAPDRPAAAAVELPVGSEFARGGDIAPVLPAPLASRSERPSQSEAPAVVAPAAEPAPIALSEPVGRPEAPATDGGLSPAALPGPEESPAIRRPEQIAPPAVAALPGFAAQSTPDRAAVTPSSAAPPAMMPPAVTPPADAAPNPPAIAAIPAPVVVPPQPLPPAAAPLMPAPALDLSLPPDLSDLRLLERN